MRTQLLLTILLLNFVAFTVPQVEKNNMPLSQMGRIEVTAYSLDQPFNQPSEGTPTPTLTQQPEKKNLAPTRTPRPTTTPVPIPPAANPNATSLMILFGLIAVIVVVVGVWLNRSDK